MQNPVLESTRILIENPQYVFINWENIEKTAEKFSHEEMKIPKWDEPVYPENLDKDTIDFIFLENTINFAFTDFVTKEKFSSEYQGKDWRGAYGMIACLKKALEKGVPILEGDFLSEIAAGKMEEIFKGNIRIPLSTERLIIFHEVGKMLKEKYNNHFYNLLEKANGQLFNQGKGLVELLISDFPSFDDSFFYQGEKVRFNKRAQLAPAILYGKFLHQKKLFSDIDDLTAFADYVLPKVLRGLEILNYESELAEKVDSQKIIPKNSQEELEIRASTIHAFEMLKNEINGIRSENNGQKINSLHLDYKLWSEGKNTKGNHHLTPTIAY